MGLGYEHPLEEGTRVSSVPALVYTLSSMSHWRSRGVCLHYSLNKITSVCARALRATWKGGDPLHNLNHPRVLTL